MLNTQVTSIKHTTKEIILGTGEKMCYDRLILAKGSRGYIPTINGFGLRVAGDAIGIRTFAFSREARRAVVAGGGSLGLEASRIRLRKWD
jgi:NAD(P)H-nitrite reductase large subunit